MQLLPGYTTTERARILLVRLLFRFTRLQRWFWKHLWGILAWVRLDAVVDKRKDIHTDGDS